MNNGRSSRGFLMAVRFGANMSGALSLDDRACVSRSAAVIVAEQRKEVAGMLRRT
jgi:hypothetical protein